MRIEVDLGLLLEVAGDASYERLQYLFAFVLAHELVHVHQYGELGVGRGELVENRLTSEEIADVELEANVKAKDILQELLLGEDAETRSSVLDFVRDRYGI